jgi:beta-fructofuranosidase
MGEIREHALENRLSHLRIYIDRSSVEIFVNNGDAVFSSRIFPTAEENSFVLSPNASMRIWKLERAVKEDFVI